MYQPSQIIGEPIPNNTEHAVSVTLPTWEAIVGYEEGDQNIVGRMKTGYPRFFIHKSIQELVVYLTDEYGRKGIENLFVYPSYTVAQRCKKYMIQRIQKLELGDKDFKKIRIVRLTTIGPRNDGEKNYRIQLALGLVFFPTKYFKYCKEFWQHSGEGISSRLAEYCLHEFKFEKLLKQRQLSGLDSLSETEEDKQFIEEKFGRNLNFAEADNANLIIRKRIINEVQRNNDDDKNVVIGNEDDVYLYPSGMSSIYNVHNIWLETLSNHKTVVFGFPYVDTLSIASKFGPGLIHLGNGSDEELDRLESSLSEGEKILGVITEVPSNPLLKTPNLKKLREIADKFGFPVAVDETIGNCLNIKPYKYADVICSSLTKIFSGDSNVLSGCLVPNKGSKFYNTMKGWLNEKYLNHFWKEDCLYLERNSRDFVNRNNKTNYNAEQVLKLFEKYQAKGYVTKIYYPKVAETRVNYENIKTKEGGYGGLISVLFSQHRYAHKFYNAVLLSKGPSLGTNFTLICPYSVLVHYNELPEVAKWGIHEDLIRISVGLEPTEELIASFESAILTAIKD